MTIMIDRAVLLVAELLVSCHEGWSKLSGVTVNTTVSIELAGVCQ